MAKQNTHTSQFEFAAAILDPDRPIPGGLVGPDGEADIKRFAVYRNNVVVGLCEALKATFPVVRRIVGDEFFMIMARSYVPCDPPASPLMFDYGGGFPDFIRDFEPASELPYLSDVALLERAWMESYYAADMASLEPNSLAGINRDAIAGLFLELHPSIRIVESAFPVLSIWQTNIEGGTPAPIDLASGGQDVLLFRPGAEVEVRLLPSGGAIFLRELINRRSVVRATKKALEGDRRFDLAANLAGLISTGGIVGYRIPAAGRA